MVDYILFFFVFLVGPPSRYRRTLPNSLRMLSMISALRHCGVQPSDIQSARIFSATASRSGESKGCVSRSEKSAAILEL